MSENFGNSILFAVAVVAAFSLGWIVHNPETLVVTNTVTLIETVEVKVPFPIYVNYTEVHYIPTAMPLIDFPSEAVLMAWIRSDRTDELDYDKRWSCMDFTLRLIRNAEAEGFRILFVYDIRNDDYHSLAMAYVVDEAKYIIWESQSDKVQLEWNSNQGG